MINECDQKVHAEIDNRVDPNQFIDAAFPPKIHTGRLPFIRP